MSRNKGVKRDRAVRRTWAVEDLRKSGCGGEGKNQIEQTTLERRREPASCYRGIIVKKIQVIESLFATPGDHGEKRRDT